MTFNAFMNPDTNNMFHFVQTSYCGGFVDAYVRKDSTVGRKLIAYKEHMLNKFRMWEAKGVEIPESIKKSNSPESVTVNGIEYEYWTNAEVQYVDLYESNRRNTFKRIVKIIERAYDELEA